MKKYNLNNWLKFYIGFHVGLHMFFYQDTIVHAFIYSNISAKFQLILKEGVAHYIENFKIINASVVHVEPYYDVTTLQTL